VERNRLLLVAGAIVAAVVVVVVIVVVAGSGSKSTSTTTAPPVTTTGSGGSGTEAQSTFAGVPQHGDTLGKPTAGATLAVYEDPQCPYCQQWNIDTLPTVVQNYVRTGRLKVVYHGVVIIGTNSVNGLRAIYAAGLQNKLWNMNEALYERQGDENSGWITIGLIKQAAREVGANAAKLIADADSATVTKELRRSEAAAEAINLNGTPTFTIQKTLGQEQQLSVAGLEPNDFTSALDAALQ